MGSARKKLDASVLEDRDKPYACDSECLTSGWVVLALDPAPAQDTGRGRVVFLLKVPGLLSCLLIGFLRPWEVLASAT